MKGFELPATSGKTIPPLQNGWGTMVDVAKKDDYVNTLTQVDLRAQEDTEERDDQASAPASTGSSSVTAAQPSTPKNRPPFLKNDPRLGGKPRHFTVRELEHFFSGKSAFFHESRLTAAARIMEDNGQQLFDVLPFGLKLHRRVGAGARTNKGDGVPGFLSKAGITVYSVTSLEFDDKDRIISLEGVGIHGERTKAYVWH